MPLEPSSPNVLKAVLRLLSPPLIHLVAAWIGDQRDRHRAAGEPLTDEQCAVLRPHFHETTLGAVRVRRVETVENPWFTRPLLALGADLDLRRAAGIAFGDTVLITHRAAECSPTDLHALLCHELVHVVQYDVFDLRGFVRRYLQGWLDHGMVYEQIPLEQQAFSIEGRFRLGILGVAEDEIRRSQL